MGYHSEFEFNQVDQRFCEAEDRRREREALTKYGHNWTTREPVNNPVNCELVTEEILNQGEENTMTTTALGFCSNANHTYAHAGSYPAGHAKTEDCFDWRPYEMKTEEGRTAVSGHTSGPWEQLTFMVTDRNHREICHCGGEPKMSIDDKLANARLIAAAPDLETALDAAPEMDSWALMTPEEHEETIGGYLIWYHNQRKAAIQKARGK